MLRFSVKSLLLDKGRLLIAVGGVAASLVLILLLDGIFRGASEQIVAYPLRTDADVWVMQQGVSNMHMTASFVPVQVGPLLEAVPGVADATPILYTSNFVEAGNGRWFSYVVGLTEDAPRGGPWSMAEGRDRPPAGSAIIPDVIAREADVGIGGSVTILGRTFQVTGISRGTFSIANSVTFVAWEDLAGLLAAKETVSYLLLKAAPGVTGDTLVGEIQAQVPGVHAMTREAFVSSDRAMALQMGVNIVQVMTGIGILVGILVIGLTMYTATARNAREYGVVKALGGRDLQLLGVVGLQALAVSAMGLVVAVALAEGLRPLVHALVPAVAVEYAFGSLLRLGAGALFIGLVAALLPAYYVARVDPAQVFKA